LKGGLVRFIGLDVHRDFCEVAISEGGKASSAGRIATSPGELELFAQSLAGDDRVALEATGNALAIARILAPHVGEVVIANPMQVRAISHAKVKADRFDARTLAELLAAGLLPSVWLGDERTRLLRRLTSRRTQLVRQRSRLKNEVSAVLVRNLKGKPPFSDLFGKQGRGWLAELELPADERDTIDACLRQLDFLAGELATLERRIAEQALDSPEIRRLMTIPGVDVTSAATMQAVIGDIARFPTSRHLVGYVGLDPSVRQSGASAARHGHISKRGSAAARHVLVEAAWAAIKTPGPLRAFYERVKGRRGSQVAIVAVARKLCALCWQLLTKQEDYAFKRATLLERKLRALELRAGAPRRRGRPTSPASDTRAAHDLELTLARQAELAYRRLVADRQASARAKTGAGAASGRASSSQPKRQAARQETAPPPAL
jgi:transposase